MPQGRVAAGRCVAPSHQAPCRRHPLPPRRRQLQGNDRCSPQPTALSLCSCGAKECTDGLTCRGQRWRSDWRQRTPRTGTRERASALVFHCIKCHRQSIPCFHSTSAAWCDVPPRNQAVWLTHSTCRPSLVTSVSDTPSNLARYVFV